MLQDQYALFFTCTIRWSSDSSQMQRWETEYLMEWKQLQLSQDRWQKEFDYEKYMDGLKLGSSGTEAESVDANAEKTVLGEAQLQSNLERGILETEQQYLAAVEEVQRETGISVGDRSSGEHNAQQSAASYRTTVGTEQTAMSVAQDGGETSTPNTELWVQQYQAEVERAEREKQQSLTESTSVIGANASVLTNETEEISEAVRAMLLQYEVETVQAELMAEEALSNAHKTREQLADEGADRLLAGQMPTDEQLLAMGKSHARALGDLAVLQMNALDDTWDTTSVHQVLSGHSGTPKKADPNTVVDHVNADGNVDSRGFYNRFGMKAKDLHTTNHGYPKQHAYGEHGEHIHEYEWDDEGRLKNKTTRDLTDEERERNGDIL